MHKLRVVVDKREDGSGVPERLKRLGAGVEYRLLDVGDYIVGSNAIERKSIDDFISSLFSGRLFDQARRLNEVFESAIIIVEGDQGKAFLNLKNPRVYWGALLSLAYDYNAKPFFTPDPGQTAELIYTLARRLEEERGYEATPMLAKRRRLSTTREWQLSIVESLPGIGPRLADRLLRAFGSVRGIFRASAVELSTKGGIGRVRAGKIGAILDARYGIERIGQQALLEEERWGADRTR